MNIRSTSMRTALGVIFTIAMASLAHAVPMELLVNGDFETGTFAGWTTTDSGLGAWFIDAPGTSTPTGGFATALNPAGGGFYAVSDQPGPGTHALTQSFFVPLNATSVMLSFDMFVNDQSGAGPIVDPAGLDETAFPNQHARVDILSAGAAPFSTAAIDVVANHYLGVDAGPNPNPYISYLFDLSGIALPGTSYQIRFAEVDNQGNFHQGVDNVSILAEVPAPSALLLMSIGLLAMATRSRRS